jgi:hypothetical protein
VTPRGHSPPGPDLHITHAPPLAAQPAVFFECFMGGSGPCQATHQ